MSLKGQLSCDCVDVFTLFLFPHRPACVKLRRCPSLRLRSGCADGAEGLQSLKESTDNSTCHLSDGLLTRKRKRRGEIERESKNRCKDKSCPLLSQFCCSFIVHCMLNTYLSHKSNYFKVTRPL